MGLLFMLMLALDGRSYLNTHGDYIPSHDVPHTKQGWLPPFLNVVSTRLMAKMPGGGNWASGKRRHNECWPRAEPAPPTRRDSSSPLMTRLEPSSRRRVIISDPSFARCGGVRHSKQYECRLASSEPCHRLVSYQYQGSWILNVLHEARKISHPSFALGFQFRPEVLCSLKVCLFLSSFPPSISF